MKRIQQLVSLCLILVMAAAFCAPVYGDQTLATSTDIPVTGGQDASAPTATPVPSRVPIITPPSASTSAPTATPTAEPTTTPTASPTPTAVPIITPTPVATVKPTVEPTATPEPTAEPTPEPTATPEPTVEPTADPTATPEPTAEPTPEPTATPEPTTEPTAEPAATPEPTVEPTAEPTATPEPTTEPDADTSANSLVFEIVDDHAVVVRYTGDSESVTIPAEYDGVPVTVIGSRAFEMASVSRVTLPSTIEAIESSAFQDCLLDSINLPEGLVSIGSYAFAQSCLPSYTLPSTLRHIGDSAFYCNGGSSLVIPASVTSLGEQAFQENGARTVVIHAPLTELPFGTFIACRNLTSVTLPGTMTRIGKNAFAESGLTSFTLPTHISSIGDVAFSYCEQLETVTVLNPEVSFGDSVFMGSDNVILRGYTGSTAQAYAEANDIPFEALDDEPTTTPEILVEVVQAEVLVDTPATIYVTAKGAVSFELGYISDRYGYKTLEARSLNGFPDDVFGVGGIICNGDTATITYYPWDGSNKLCVKAILNDNEYIYSEEFTINGIFHGTLNAFECYIDMDELPRVGRDIVIRWAEPAHAEYYICQVIMPDGSQYVETVTDACLLIPSGNVSALGKMEVTVQAHAAGFFYNSETIRPYIYGNIPLDSIIMPDTAIRRQETAIKWNPTKEKGTVWGTIYISNDQWPYGELSWSTMTHTNGADADGYVHIQFNKNSLSRPGTYTYYFICDESSSGNGDQYITDTYTLHVSDPGNSDYYYDAWNTGARLSGYVGSATEVTIPETIAGVPVVNIEQSFYYDWMLISVNIPDTIGELNGYTFRECTNLRKVTLPSNLMRINSTVFGNCDSLQEISIPASVEEISGYVFSSCDNLRKVIIYSRNVKIDRVAFNGCPNVTLYGYLGSTTEAYAKANNIPFVPLDGEAEQDVAFTMNKSTALVGKEVTFVITAPGATELKLLADAGTDSAYEETFAATGDKTTYIRAFSRDGVRSIQFSALVNGEWTEPCEAQTLTLTSLGQLDQPVVSIESPVYTNEAFSATWTAVENAQSYALHVTLSGMETWSGATADTNFTIPGTAVASAGNYCLLVQPVAVGYSQNEGACDFTVTVRPPEKAGPVTYRNVSDGDILTGDTVTVKWNAAANAASYLVSLRDTTTDTVLLPQTDVGMQTAHPLPTLTAGHSYRFWVAAIPAGVTYAGNPELCSAKEVEFSWRSVPAFTITSLDAPGALGEPVTVSWEAPVWPLEPGLTPDYYVVWWYGPGLENGIPQMVAQGETLTSTLPGELTGQPGAYRVAVYACMYDSWAEVHSMTEATFTVAPETDGAITAIYLNERNVTNEHRYTFTGTLTYIVRTSGPASGVNVQRNGASIGAMTPWGQADDGSCDWLFSLNVRIPEGVHVLTFVTEDGTSTAITNIAGITRSDPETIMYTSIEDAQLRTWPATTIGSPVLLTRNTSMLVRGYCGDYAYVQIDGVNRFLLKDHLWPYELTEMRAGEWFFEVRSNSMFVYSEQMEDNLGEFVLVMAEGSPTANLRTLRAFEEPEHVFTYQPSVRYYNQLFSFDRDLELDEGKQYHFAVVPKGTPVSSVTSFMFSYMLQSESIITSPTDGAWIDLWNGEPLELRWRLRDGCTEYTVQIYVNMDLPYGMVPTPIFSETYAVQDIQLNSTTGRVILTAADFAELQQNANIASDLLALRICITAH